MELFSKTKNVIRTWFNITPAQKNIYYLNETFSFESNVAKNRTQMRGDPEELDEFYKQLGRDNSYFWATGPHIKIRKIHPGLPSSMVQVLTDIVMYGLNGIEVEARQVDWDNINKDNNFNEVLRKAVKGVLFIGDGVFKISFDKKFTQYPIIEFIPGDKVEIVYERGRFTEYVFKTEYKYAYKHYVHYEHYGKGHIKDVLTEWGVDDPLPLSTIPQITNIIDVAFAGYKLSDGKGKNEAYGQSATAVPSKTKGSTKWKNRGESIFSKKTLSFDGLDEIVSQWVDTVRATRIKQYIPKMLISRDPETRQTLQSNQYDDEFLMIEGNMKEKGENQIDATQPVIPSENYLQPYISFLDLCLQGVISPPILSTDTKKMDNAEHREKKKKPCCIQEMSSLK